jgi:hypothetical protein
VLRLYGKRERKFIDSDGTALILIIRRLWCQKCEKIHHELPDILVPYKRHCADTIEKIISGHAGETPCEESTTRRIRIWWAMWKLYFECVLASLGEKYGAAFSASPTPKEIVRAVVNANLWPATRSAFLSG